MNSTLTIGQEATRLEPSFFGHPRGLATLFLTEMWERFSYYGTRALLILFMTASPAVGGLGFVVPKAAAIYGLYTASVYLFGLPGGWIADRILGLRRAVFLGGLLIAAGNYTLIVPGSRFFYVGLSLIVVGTGLLKANISAIVGELYSVRDVRRDAGFSLFYMGINLGSFLAPLACGYLGERVGWRWGFGLAALGMTLGLAQYHWGTKYLGSAGLRVIPGPKKVRARIQLVVGMAVVAWFAILILVLSNRFGRPITAEMLSNAMGVFLLIVSLAIFCWFFFGARWSREERRRVVVILALFLASALFWAIFEQAGSTLNLFAKRNTNCEIWGHPFPPSWFQSLGPLFIILLAPLFAKLWIALGSRDPSSPKKFVAGLVLGALGFAVLILPLIRGADRVSPLWLVATYLLHTAGELCVSPVGLSAMTKLAPVRAAGLIMGVWFLSTAAGNYLGSRFAGLYEVMPLVHLFGWVACTALFGALLLALSVRQIERLTPDRALESARGREC